MKKIFIFLSIVFIVGVVHGSILKDYFINDYSLEELKQIYEKSDEISRANRELVVMEVLYTTWDGSNWVNDELQTYSYDDETGFYNELLMQIWDGSSWQNFFKFVIENNEYGWPLETLVQMWDAETQSWMDASLMTTTYNADGHPTYSLVQMNMGEMWMDMEQMTYTWDNDFLMEILTEEWDFGMNNWINADRELYTYDGEDQIQELEQMWENESEWIDDSKTTMTYDGNHHMMESLQQSWDQVQWYNGRHSTYSYDNDWNEIQELELEWDYDAESWVNFQDKYYTWENGLMVERLTYEWDETRNWENHSMQTFTYGDLSNSDEVILPKINLTNYPNPFNPTTIIKFSIQDGNSGTLSIYNTKGQLIESKDFSTGEYSYHWNADKLTSGIYFYKLQTENYSKVRKMLLMK